MKNNAGITLLASAGLVCFSILMQTSTIRGEAEQVLWQAPEDKAAVQNPIPGDEKSIASGKEIYTRKCLSCHGTLGKGDGSTARSMEKKMPDFSDGNWMSKQTDGALFYKLTVGKKPMPSYKKTLTDEERWQVINYLRTLTSNKK